jgi:hypothetical protein
MLKIKRLMTEEELNKYNSLAETPNKQKKYIQSLQQELFGEVNEEHKSRKQFNSRRSDK